MQERLQITFRNMDATPEVETRIREATAKLEEVEARMIGCRVLVEARHRHHHKGGLYHVRIDLTVPGHEIAISRDPELDHAHEDVQVAIRDAFEAARRRLVHTRERRA